MRKNFISEYLKENLKNITEKITYFIVIILLLITNIYGIVHYRYWLPSYFGISDYVTCSQFLITIFEWEILLLGSIAPYFFLFFSVVLLFEVIKKKHTFNRYVFLISSTLIHFHFIYVSYHYLVGKTVQSPGLIPFFIFYPLSILINSNTTGWIVVISALAISLLFTINTSFSIISFLKLLKKSKPNIQKTQEYSKKIVNTNQNKLEKEISSSSQIYSSEQFTLPPSDLLIAPPQKSEKVRTSYLRDTANRLQQVLLEFGVKGNMGKIHPGPVVTLFEFEPAPGIKSTRIIGLASDIARSMSAISTRISVIPGRNVMGIEIPNKTRQTVYLKDLIQDKNFHDYEGNLPIVLGHDIQGSSVLIDLAKTPHLLIAGTTGSGKSVSVNAIILSLLFRLKPDQCRLVMIDPKMLELSVYDGIPHLIAPVVTDPKFAVQALKWSVSEMEQRYSKMSKLGVRNLENYNQRIQEAQTSGEILSFRSQTGFDQESGKPIFDTQTLSYEKLPYIVIVVDEMADLMMVAGKEIEVCVQRLAQMARAAGIHLIMATQRPSVDVITGTIKANFPTRISFHVTSKIDSRTILGEQGAEQLLGRGDMLYMKSGGQTQRVHGPFVSDKEVERIVKHLRKQEFSQNDISINFDSFDESASLQSIFSDDSKEDALMQQAITVMHEKGKISTSLIQRHLRIGYNKAANIVEKMEEKGLISAADHTGKRKIL